MAESWEKTLSEADLNSVDHESEPLMLHMMYDRQALDALYPGLTAPQEITEGQESQWASWDEVTTRGEEIVREIQARTIAHGRRRYGKILED